MKDINIAAQQILALVREYKKNNLHPAVSKAEEYLIGLDNLNYLAPYDFIKLISCFEIDNFIFQNPTPELILNIVMAFAPILFKNLWQEAENEEIDQEDIELHAREFCKTLNDTARYASLCFGIHFVNASRSEELTTIIKTHPRLFEILDCLYRIDQESILTPFIENRVVLHENLESVLEGVMHLDYAGRLTRQNISIILSTENSLCAAQYLTHMQHIESRIPMLQAQYQAFTPEQEESHVKEVSDQNPEWDVEDIRRTITFVKSMNISSPGAAGMFSESKEDDKAQVIRDLNLKF